MSLIEGTRVIMAFGWIAVFMPGIISWELFYFYNYWLTNLSISTIPGLIREWISHAFCVHVVEKLLEVEREWPDLVEFVKKNP